VLFPHGIVGVEDAAYALGGGVVVVGGVDGEEFGDQFRAVWEGGVHVGEGAASIDGEVKLPIAIRIMSHHLGYTTSCRFVL